MSTRIFRTLGAINLFFAAIGLGTLALQSWAFSLFPSEVTGGEGDPLRLAFRIGQFASIVLLPLLAYFGLQLVRLRIQMIMPCAFLFIAEIVYFILTKLLWPWIFLRGILTAMRSGLLNAGFGLQALTGYPLLALIALYLLHRRVGNPLAGSQQNP